jgi:HSP20 family protein
MLRPFGRRPDLTVGADPFTSLQREMDRVFESFGRDLGWAGDNGRAMAPSIDVSETDEALEIKAELPGVDQKDVDVTVTDDVLTIKGEKKVERDEKGKSYHVVERSRGSFVRSLTLPFNADPAKTKASFVDGVLTITLPKPPEVEAKVKKIAIGK